MANNGNAQQQWPTTEESASKFNKPQQSSGGLVEDDNEAQIGGQAAHNGLTTQTGSHQDHDQPMSCYVCSTMDYENPADNLCRSLRHHQRGSPAIGGHNLMLESPFATPSKPGPARDSATLTSAAPEPDLRPSSSQEELGQSGDQSSPNQTSSNQSSSALARPFQNQAHRAQQATNYIRTRACSAEENFCSVVSIVRIEIVSDNLYSRFWAMER